MMLALLPTKELEASWRRAIMAWAIVTYSGIWLEEGVRGGEDKAEGEVN
jgi:hypothetical protein